MPPTPFNTPVRPLQDVPFLERIDAGNDVDLERWIASHRADLAMRLTRSGAVLLRGFHVVDTPSFSRAVAALDVEHQDYTYRSTPRTRLAEGVYSATEYPAHQRIPMHNENSYQRRWPSLLAFCCLQPAQVGGETLLASSVEVTRRIDPVLRQTFAERGVRYVRNYGLGVDLPWQDVFQTERVEDVEDFCRRDGIEWRWNEGGTLRTWQNQPALATHGASGQTLWFNQAHLFHPSSLDTRILKSLLAVFAEELLPRNALHADGGAIDPQALTHIRDCYDAATVTLTWQASDVLLLDNMLVCHGRNPYQGPRHVVVSMLDPRWK